MIFLRLSNHWSQEVTPLLFYSQMKRKLVGSSIAQDWADDFHSQVRPVQWMFECLDAGEMFSW